MKKAVNRNFGNLRAITGYERNASEFEKSSGGGLQGIAEQISEKIADIEESRGIVVPMEKDPKLLKDMIGNDIRESVPPRIYSIISEIVGVVEDIEK